MSAQRLSLALSMALAASPILAYADGHAHSSGGSGGSSSGGGHPSANSSHAASRSHSSGGSGSSGSSGAQYRHPQAGTGTGYHYRSGGHGYGGGRGGYYPYYGYGYGYRYPYWGWGGGLYYYGGYPYYSYDDGYYAGGAGGDYYGGARSYSRASGAVRLLVEPDDAKVYVDGSYSGVVDDYDGFAQRLYLPAGRHEILLRRDGYQSQRFKVYVSPDNTLKLHCTMEKGAGDAPQEVVVGDPSAEQYSRDVRRDDDRRRYEDADRDGDRDRDDRDRPADRQHLRRDGDERRHEAARDGVAPVHLNVKPDDASVYVDGRFYGTAREANRLQLTPGRHRVEVVRPGYRTYDHDVDVGTDSPTDLDVTLER